MVEYKWKDFNVSHSPLLPWSMSQTIICRSCCLGKQRKAAAESNWQKRTLLTRDVKYFSVDLERKTESKNLLVHQAMRPLEHSEKCFLHYNWIMLSNHHQCSRHISTKYLMRLPKNSSLHKQLLNQLVSVRSVSFGLEVKLQFQPVSN